jgi:hypothetical protein
MIVGGHNEVLRRISGRAMERQRGPTPADAIQGSVKPSRQRFSRLVQRKLDAGRAAIDCQDIWLSSLHG